MSDAPAIHLIPSEKRLLLAGVDLPVANVYYSPEDKQLGRPPMTPDVRNVMLQWQGEEKLTAYEHRRMAQPDKPEFIVVSILCGENKWWIELLMWPDSGMYHAERCDVVHNADGSCTPPLAYDAEEILLLWKETGERRDAPWDASPHVMTELDDPYGGYPPGYWDPDTPEVVLP